MQIGDTVQILQHDLAVVHANQDPVPRVHWVYAIVLEVLKNDAGDPNAAMVEVSHPGNFQHGQRMVVSRKEIRTAADLQALHDAHPHRDVERPSYENPEHKELINLRAALARCAPAVLMLLAFLLLPSVSFAQCDQSLWAHVYHQARLKILKSCVTVSGVIVDATHGKKKDGVRHEADGDPHGWLRVDPEFADLLNAGNRLNEGGNLVFEVVCMFRVTQKDAVDACRGYHATVKLPAVGCRVAITGALVQDQEHAQWNEIHPVTKIDVLGCG